jgi:hypothetical protein
MRWAMPPEHPNPRGNVAFLSQRLPQATRIWQSSETNTSVHAMQQHNMHFVVFRTVASRQVHAADGV